MGITPMQEGFNFSPTQCWADLCSLSMMKYCTPRSTRFLKEGLQVNHENEDPKESNSMTYSVMSFHCILLLPCHESNSEYIPCLHPSCIFNGAKIRAHNFSFQSIPTAGKWTRRYVRNRFLNALLGDSGSQK